MDRMKRALGGFLAAALVAGAAFAAAPESPGAAYRRGDFAEAIRLVTPQAKRGRIDAQMMLGQMYLKGEGVPADAVTGVEWIHKAADQGSDLAAFQMGLFAASGIGGPADMAGAAAWYRRAAHQGYADAAYNLAVLYHSGRGVERSDALALNWSNAAIAWQPASAPAEMTARFTTLRDSVLAGMTPDERIAAPRLVSTDGPLLFARPSNEAELFKKGSKEYPLGLRQLARGGTVVALLLVRADGTVGESRIETSTGHAALDEATLRLLGSAHVPPRRVDGRAIDSWQLVKWKWTSFEQAPTFSSMNAMRSNRVQ